MLQLRLLRILSDGQWHSLADLAMCLDCASADIRAPIDTGVRSNLLLFDEIFGYRLRGQVEFLDEQHIFASLAEQTKQCLQKISVNDQLDSTNSECWRIAAENNGLARFACLAEAQQSGRGSRGRKWVSPLLASISMSVFWQMNCEVEKLSGLSLAVGCVIAEVIKNFDCSAALALKWPNDIYVGNTKLGGVLVEVQKSTFGHDVVIGIGLNYRDSEELLDVTDRSVMSLDRVLSNLPSRNLIVTKILDGLSGLLGNYIPDGFSAWQKNWNDMDIFKGQVVIFSDRNGDVLEAKNLGVDESGALMLDVDGVRRRYLAGEIALKIT